MAGGNLGGKHKKKKKKQRQHESVNDINIPEE